MKQKKTEMITGRRRKLYELISSATELPSDAVSSIPTFVIRGLHEVEADGCDGILEYGDQSVMLAVRGRRVYIKGDSLTLSDFFGESLTVRGNITSISITEDENA